MDCANNDTMTDKPAGKPMPRKNESVIQTLTRLSVEMGAMGRHCSSAQRSKATSETETDPQRPVFSGQCAESAENGEDRTS